jgi:hypothetical protein
LQQFYQVEEIKDFKSMIPSTFLRAFEKQKKLADFTNEIKDRRIKKTKL